ncbi:MAG: type I 3-dehydroquinate dehydratase [Cellulomonadaceae bacterium]|nr:type I 3-dehydroquinate dehydratase [Cellulomonadaceae bacterium]
MACVTVRGVTLGEGAAKVIVPLTGSTVDELTTQAAAVVAAAPDVVEWRVDFLDDALVPASVVAAGREVVAALAGLPLLVTFRTADEGGEKAITAQQYVDLYAAVVEAGVADLLDVEILRDEQAVASIIGTAHAAAVPVVASSHDFGGTPDADELVARLRLMAERGADVLKVAVMPHGPQDVLTLLQATWTAAQELDQPLITMSMAATGVVSRLAGEVFGSTATFGMVGRASAPGQVEVGALRQALALIHGPV